MTVTVRVLMVADSGPLVAYRKYRDGDYVASDWRVFDAPVEALANYEKAVNALADAERELERFKGLRGA